MIQVIKVYVSNALRIFSSGRGKAADDDVWGWDGGGADGRMDGSGAHVLEAQDGSECGTFQMQICHERTRVRVKDSME